MPELGGVPRFFGYEPNGVEGLLPDVGVRIEMTTASATHCACAGSDVCGWISHVDGLRCSNSFAGTTLPLGWERAADRRIICASCAFIRHLREDGPMSPSPVKRHATASGFRL